MNRVTITLTPHGEIARICSDEPIECYWVSPHTPHDRVYLFDAVYTGPQFVREEIGGYAVGHADDGTFRGNDAPISPKLLPRRRALRAISDDREQGQ